MHRLSLLLERMKKHRCYSVRPNIKGTTSGWSGQNTGCFKTVETNKICSPGDYYTYDIADFDATKSSALYGASDTVQPAGLYVQMLIRYAA